MARSPANAGRLGQLGRRCWPSGAYGARRRRTSATRLVEHFLPLALFAAALWLDERRPIIRPWR